jgi:hypothetical protein
MMPLILDVTTFSDEEPAYLEVPDHVDCRCGNFPTRDVWEWSTYIPGNIDGHYKFGVAVNPNEWKCDWCGSPNPKDNTHCSQCGGARSFIYGDD